MYEAGERIGELFQAHPIVGEGKNAIGVFDVEQICDGNTLQTAFENTRDFAHTHLLADQWLSHVWLQGFLFGVFCGRLETIAASTTPTEEAS